ncbi:MAG: hypothetical protein Q9206_007173 [Seirophora lacunosa]
MLIRKPEELGWVEVAGVPETWITATQAMYLIGEYAPGKTILWHAGASSVSIAGIQLSKGDGAGAIYVTAGSQEKIDFCVKELGATAGFNYRTQDWANEVLAATDGKGVDIIVDFVGQNYFQGNLDAAARDGRIVHLGAMSGTKLPAAVDIGAFVRKRVRFEGSSLRSRDEGYQGKLRDTLVQHALPLLRKGEMKVFVEKVLPWERIVEAHELMESNRTKGKIISRNFASKICLANMTKRQAQELHAASSIGLVDVSGSSEAKKRKLKDVNNDATVNGKSDKSKLSKEERRELKKRKKLEAGDGTRAPARNDVEKVQVNEELDKAAAKAARKVEKARIKAAKVNDLGKKEPNGESSETERKSRRRIERKAQKARKEAQQDEKKDDDSGMQNGHISPKPAYPASTAHVEQNYEEDKGLTALSDTEVQSFLSSNFIAIEDPSSATLLRPITKFSYLPKSSQSPAFSAFKAPTAIQAAAWPFLLSRRDVIGVAETGSGKTLAFGIPCIRSVSSFPSSKKAKTPARAVIISPTRELTVQIHTQIEQLASPASLKSVCVYGGVPKDPQRLALSTAHIVVATPGRLQDLIDEGSADLSQVQYLVLDEADRMLEKGFEDAIRKIVSTTPSTAQGRQTLMFTATWPESVRALAATFMAQPVRITIGEDNADGELRANTRIEQRVEVVDPRGKETRMLQIIKKHQSGSSKDDRVLVFCLYKKEATRVEGFLRSKGLRVAGIHGDLSQGAREAALAGFKKGECPLLVATDVAARGLDIPNVKLVLNVTFPLTVEDYVHRIGRTGRAGAHGLAITLFTEHDKAQSGALINVLKAAGQPVPEELLKFGTTVKKKGHDAYGAFYKDTRDSKGSTKIKFDD